MGARDSPCELELVDASGDVKNVGPVVERDKALVTTRLDDDDRFETVVPLKEVVLKSIGANIAVDDSITVDTLLW